MKSVLRSLLAALALAAPSPAQVPEVVFWTGFPIGSGNAIVTGVGPPHAGPDGGYVLEVSLEDPATGSSEGVFWGDPVDDGTTTPAVLRELQTIGGAEQTNIYQPRLGGGRIAYGASIRVAPFQTEDSLWRDSELLFRENEPSPFAGFNWGPTLLYDVDASGEVLASLYLRPTTTSGAIEWALMRFPSRQVLLRTGDLVAGYPQPVDRFFEISTSPDGLHYGCVVLFVDGGVGLVVDGAIARIDGVPLLRGEVIPPRAGGDGSMTFFTFGDVRLDDHGGLSIVVGVLSGNSHETLHIRNGYRSWRTGDVVDGFEVFSLYGPRATRADLEVASLLDRIGPHYAVAVTLEGKVLAQSGDAIDVDGDGVADPPIRLHPRTPNPRSAIITARGDVYFQHVTSDVAQSWFRFALLRLPGSVGDPTCAGRPNSTGRGGRLAVLGSDRLVDNGLCVRAYDLPPGVVGYFLASQAGGFVANPGGSQGDLCLSGAIGRYASQAMNSGGLGAAQLELDLRSVAQPAGSVAAQVGETWHFQCWHRDSVGGASTSNFTSAARATLR